MPSADERPYFAGRLVIAMSLNALLGIALCVALVSAEGIWPSRAEARFHDLLTGRAADAASVADTDFVEMSRGRCYGQCPVYSVRVQANGEVTFVGREHVCREGEVRRRIAPEQARRLLAALRSVGWAAAPAPDSEDAATLELRLRVSGTDQLARYQPRAFGRYLLTMAPAAIDRVAGVGALVPDWQLSHDGPRCAGENGRGYYTPQWWLDWRAEHPHR